jgi:hypothetical protein
VVDVVEGIGKGASVSAVSVESMHPAVAPSAMSAPRRGPVRRLVVARSMWPERIEPRRCHPGAAA